jgi:aryl-alcohol dehydrogenase-like predicted oxidoreductase
MNYRILGKTGLKVSEIGFGSWAIGGPSESVGTPWGWGEVSERDATAAVERARELGVNFFDTADVYGDGHSEEMLGRALGPGWKGAYVASKVGNVVRDQQEGKDWSREHITRSCEASLKRLRKDMIDVYQLHNPEIADVQNGDWPETMERLREQGKIRWYGVSVFVPEEAMAVLERGAGHVIQLAYNALRLEMEEEVLPRARRDNIGIIARVPLYYGVLAGKFQPGTTFPANDHRSHTLAPEVMKELVPRADRLKPLAGSVSLAQWALQFVLANPVVSTVIPGARNPRQAEQNCKAAEAPPLPQEQVVAVGKFWKSDPYLRALRTGL